MIFRLDPPIPLWTTKGEGLAHFIVDYGLHEHHMIWGVTLYLSGAWWWLENPEVRSMVNQTIGRTKEEWLPKP